MGRRLAWRVVLSVLALGLWSGCGSDDKRVREKKPLATVCEYEAIASCRNDVDCGSGLGCRDGCCLPSCELPSDCGAATHCGELGCVCDEGICQGKVCASDAGCDQALVCEAGVCVMPTEVAEVSQCEISPLYGVLLDIGDVVSLSIHASDANGKPLPVRTGFVFASSDTGKAVVDPSGRVEGGEASGSVEITATWGSATCTASFLNLGRRPPDLLRVVAVDELTGLPIHGAMVQVEAGLTPVSQSTGARGEVGIPLSAVGEFPRTVSVFHDDYVWLTVVDTVSTSLRLPMRRLIPEDRAGGIRGTFGPEALFDPEDVHAGLAGTSIPGNPIDISLPILVGPTRRTLVTIGDEREVDIPSGVILGLGNTWFKEEYQALGVPGACPDRSRSAAGLCGVRSAWGIAGGVPLLDLPLDQITEGSLAAGGLLAELLPQFRHFRSAVVRDVVFEMAPTTDDLPNASRLTPVDLQATQRLALRPTLLLPPLPMFAGGRFDGVIALGGAEVQGRGLVPLGITAGLDAAEGEKPDGMINDPEGRSNGELPLRMAPQHGGVEGNPYRLLALAANFGSIGDSDADCTVEDRTGCTALAGLMDRRDDLAFDATIDLRTDGFVGLASAATWQPDIRAFSLGKSLEGSPDLLRLQLVGDDGRSWHVWFPAEVDQLTVPVPGGMSSDRVIGSRASLQAMRAGATLDSLLGSGSRRLSTVGESMRAFSTVDLPRQ